MSSEGQEETPRPNHDKLPELMDGAAGEMPEITEL